MGFLVTSSGGDDVRLWKVPCDCSACIQRGGGFWVAVGGIPNLEFDLIRGEQKSRTLYSGLGEAWVLDFAARVPALDEDEGYSDIADKIRTRDIDAWQRMLSEERQQNIGEFWRRPGKHIVNSVMISFDTTPDIPIDEVMIPGQAGSGKFTMSAEWMDFSCRYCQAFVSDALLEKRNRLAGQDLSGKQKYMLDVIDEICQLGEGDPHFRVYSDHCANNSDCDHHKAAHFNGKKKHLQIIDGQHRTRGMNSWENYRMLIEDFAGYCQHHENKVECEADGCTLWNDLDEVVTELVPLTISHFKIHNEDQGQKAAIFLEVNTKAEDLSPFHKLAMLARENFPPTVIKNWPGAKDSYAPKEFDFSSETTADSLRYRFILNLCSNNNLYPFFNAIPILKVLGSKRNTTIIDVRDLWTYLEGWNGDCRVFSSDGCFSAVADMNAATQKFAEYFEAWAYHLSGPCDPNAVEENTRHFWAPTHPDARNEGWGLQSGGWAWKRAVGACPRVQEDAMGEVGRANQDVSRMAQGIWALTGYMRFILDFFEPICSTILTEKMGEEGDEWTPDQYDLNGGHNGIHASLGLEAFKEKIEQLLTAFPFGGAIFNERKFGLEDSDRKDTLKLVCDRLGWVV